MGILDKFIRKKSYDGENIRLVESYRTNEKTAYDGVPTVYYDIERIEDKVKVGRIELRLTIEGKMYYYGHIGYTILKQFRGNHYAYQACEVLFQIAKEEFNMKELIITCSPENVASYKILTKLGGEIIDLVEVPNNHPLYLLGEKTKYIFRYKIG